MTKFELNFLPVDWPNSAPLCAAFRRDAWHISYGNMQAFSESDTKTWFEWLAKNYSNSFLHVWHTGKIIGQIEYRAPITENNSETGGYINLFYLIPSQRRQGLGQIMHDFVVADLRSKHCQIARLRLIVGNAAAEQFYAKNGWNSVGVVDDKKAQLMALKL